MRTRSLNPATTAMALLMVIAMALFSSGCGRDEGSPVAPLDQLTSNEQVRQLCEQLRVAGAETETMTIWNATSKDQPAAVSKECREIHGADGWMADYAYAKGQFTQHLWPGGPGIAGRIPYVGIMARGNGTCTPTMGCDTGWW